MSVRPPTPDAAFGVPADVLVEGLRVVGWAMSLALVLPLLTESVAYPLRLRPRSRTFFVRLHAFYARQLENARLDWVGTNEFTPGELRECLRREIDLPDDDADASSEPESTLSVRFHVAERGDSLWTLAERFYGDPRHWPALREANLMKLGPDGQVRAGSVLTVPGLIGSAR